MNELKLSMIVIGDEILSGRTKDLNAQWLAQFLFKIGIRLSSIKFIHDDYDEFELALKTSLCESDIVLTSGGIGPTLDDLTKNALAKFYKKSINKSIFAEDVVKKNYLRLNRVWNPDLNQYHLFPEDFIPVNNPLGLAPGLCFYSQDEGKLILSGPGVPREFSAMVETEFLKNIQLYFPNRFKSIYQTVIRTTGISEEKIFFELCPTLWKDLEKWGKVSSLPHILGIDIVVSYFADSSLHTKYKEEIESFINKSELATFVWQLGNLPINELILNLAIKNNYTFGFAESCTGGLISSKITDLNGSSKVFKGSVVCYQNEIKTKLLGVNEETIKKFGVVSKEVAEEMAKGAKRILNVDFAISITGLAGATVEGEKLTNGTFVIGFSSERKTGSFLYNFPGDRLRLKEKFSDTALLVLLNLIIEKF